MKPLMMIVTSLGLALTVSATSAQAIAGRLRNHQPVNNGLINIAIADMIRKECDQIGARMIHAYRYMNAIRDRANEDGFSDAEIEAFVENKEDRARVKTAAQTYLTSNGVTLDDPQSYCVAGLAEIDQDSQIGALLRSK